ncbi:uncharacterized protein I303_105249 [Kwoniella dejecticola CBS 10117]|uniref:Asparagine-tRNA ligase n=1 Tax=Kwoniella dejecticola CBS 10117 TaxID=1296121 RepID=A0A1A6A317_9TREE|nr:asparagine-tRNA ligase [Kwoniella dejecticola CBS 10117]OBR84445.1 asparagine-tRNA ligase [Kwoniella dejecticola CBS 10117]
MRCTPIRLSTLPPTLRSVLTAAQNQLGAPSTSPSASSSSAGRTDSITVNGWIKSIRTHKNVSFLEVNDGSGASIQAVLKGKGRADNLTNGTSVTLLGELKKSRGQGQDVELVVEDVKILGGCDPETYPIQKKSLPPSILRENAHLRFRTSQTAAIMRTRDSLMRDWHDWFEDNQFTYIHTPILTGSDCEGAGEVFTLLDRSHPNSDLSPHTRSGSGSQSSPSLGHAASEGVGKGKGVTNEKERDGPFFPHPVHLTVSSQLHLEAPTHALSRVYTLSPSFRAEPSLTSRHLCEFYMLEGEVGFIDTLDQLLDVVEDGIKQTVERILNVTSKRGERVREDLKVISKSLADYHQQQQQVNQHQQSVSSSSSASQNVASTRNQDQSQNASRGETDLTEITSTINPSDPLNHLRQIIAKPFTRITYTQAITLLDEYYRKDIQEGELPIKEPTRWGEGISSENEKWLSNHFGGPVFVTRYPKTLKPFYMLPTPTPTSASAEDEGAHPENVDQTGRETVECFDLLFPNIGEMAGGSLREHRLSHLVKAIEDAGMKKEEYEWYIDLRRYGSVPHGGWGMGWDRWISFVTGVGNVKDVVAYPRWKGHCKY